MQLNSITLLGIPLKWWLVFGLAIICIGALTGVIYAFVYLFNNQKVDIYDVSSQTKVYEAVTEESTLDVQKDIKFAGHGTIIEPGLVLDGNITLQMHKKI